VLKDAWSESYGANIAGCLEGFRATVTADLAADHRPADGDWYSRDMAGYTAAECLYEAIGAEMAEKTGRVRVIRRGNVCR